MDRFGKLKNDFEKAIKRLEEAVNKAMNNKGTEDYTFYRDSAIQRFEIAFELMWKTVKLFLEKEGIICRSPRTCIRELFSAGFIQEEEARELLRMIDYRNMTVHTYDEEIAEEIFKKLPLYVDLFRSTFLKLKG